MRSLRSLTLFTTLLVATACANTRPPDGPASRPSEESKMMVIRVVMKIKPASDSAFRSYFAEETRAVQALPGCQRYELFAAAEQPGAYLLYEEWASAEAFDAYRNGPTLKKSFEVLGPMLDGPPDSAYYSGARVGP